MPLFTKKKEIELEEKCDKWARTKGWTPRKLVSPGRRGRTDKFYTKRFGQIFFVEFKRDKNEEPTAQQILEHQRLVADGFDVYVVTYFEEFCAIVDAR